MWTHLSYSQRRSAFSQVSWALPSLPPRYPHRGFPTGTSYPTHFDKPDIGDAVLTEIESGPVTHGVTIHTVRSFFVEYLGCEPRDGFAVTDWLTFPEQRLCTIASGRVFHDGLGELESIRESLRYYPRDLWLYLLAGQWRRIDQ